MIASTGGRAFWILDDIGLIRQYDSSIISKKEIHLYIPENAYRVSGGSALDKVISEDPIGPEPTGDAGKNPSTGVVIYYQLAQRKDSAATLSLEILDEQNNLVRRYSSKADEKFVSYPGGPNGEPLLTVKNGLNRFVWDLRYSTMPGVSGVYIEGSYIGHRVVPGKYIAHLKLGNQDKQVAFTVMPDPRIKASNEAYVVQHQLLSSIETGVKEIHLSVTSIRKAREQINYLLSLVNDQPDLKVVVDSGKKVVEIVTNWEEKLVQPRSQSYDDIINFENKLSADFIFIHGEADTNIPFVTDGQQQVLRELNDKWLLLKNELATIIGKHIGVFNKLCAEKKLEKVTVVK